MNTDTATSDGEPRCFPCCLGSHRACYGAPCECGAHTGRRWPAQTTEDPLDLPVQPARDDREAT